MSRLWRVGVVLVTLLTVVSSGATAVSARQAGSLELIAQTAFVPSEGTFQVTLSWSGAIDPDMSIGGLLYAPVADESEITEPPTVAFSAVPTTPLDSLPRTAEGHLVFEIGIRSVEDGDSERLRLREAGVYPLQLDVRSAEGTTLATLRTNLIRLPTEAAEIEVLPISTVIAISSAEGLTVGPATELLTSHPDVPIAVVLGDGVLTQLESQPQAALDLREALDGRPVIVRPSPRLDVSALAAIGRPDLYITTRDATLTRVENLGLRPQTEVAVVDPTLTIGGIDLLADAGVSVVIDTSTTSRPTGILEGTSTTLRVVQVDDTLSSAMRGTSRTVERVHRLLAALTLRSSTDRSPILVGGEGFRGVPISSIQLFLSALEQPGTLGTTDVVDAASASPLLPIRPLEQPNQDLVSIASTIEQATTAIGIYRAFYVDGGLPPLVYENALVDALAVGRNPDDRARALQQLVTNLDERFTDIALPEGQSVTLAAQRAEIPITIENRSDGDRSVRLSFESDKIDVVQDETTVVLPPGVSTVNIELEARSLGRSPLIIRVLTPTGDVELSTTSFGVRSTAIPGLGLLLSAAALVFLMSWWIVSITRSRAQRVHPANTQPARSTDGDDPTTAAAEAKLSS